MAYAEDFERALQVGRPPTSGPLPNSKALIVSGKVVDRAIRAKARPSRWPRMGVTPSSSVARCGGTAGQCRHHHRHRQVEGGQKAYSR